MRVLKELDLPTSLAGVLRAGGMGRERLAVWEVGAKVRPECGLLCA